MTVERHPSEVNQALENLRGELESRGVRASRIGKSALQGAHVELRVYLPNSSTDEGQIPSRVDNFPVRVVRTGEIRAQ